jgi:hypothetical protein
MRIKKQSFMDDLRSRLQSYYKYFWEESSLFGARAIASRISLLGPPPPKLDATAEAEGITSKKTAFFIVTAVKTSDPTSGHRLTWVLFCLIKTHGNHKTPHPE